MTLCEVKVFAESGSVFGAEGQTKCDATRHYYEFVPTEGFISWADARAAAAERERERRDRGERQQAPGARERLGGPRCGPRLVRLRRAVRPEGAARAHPVISHGRDFFNLLERLQTGTIIH